MPENAVSRPVGELIRRSRKRQGIRSAKKFAMRVTDETEGGPVSAAAMYSYESGKVLPPWPTAMRIAAVLELQEAEFGVFYSAEGSSSHPPPSDYWLSGKKPTEVGWMVATAVEVLTYGRVVRRSLRTLVETIRPSSDLPKRIESCADQFDQSLAMLTCLAKSASCKRAAVSELEYRELSTLANFFNDVAKRIGQLCLDFDQTMRQETQAPSKQRLQSFDSWREEIEQLLRELDQYLGACEHYGRPPDGALPATLLDETAGPRRLVG